jgi:PAS domain S-box-containing protein
MSVAAEFAWTPQDPKTELRVLFENAPVGLALCHPNGKITALNRALERMLGDASNSTRSWCFAELLHPRDRDEGERLLQELFEKKRDGFQVEAKTAAANSRRTRWTVWRVFGTNGESDYGLAMAEEAPDSDESERRLRQAQRLEAVGRLTGGVAHDFNNLLTGVMLYCDLLSASLGVDHLARNYAQEIRKAALQATGLIRQLLALARPTDSEAHLLSLNDIAQGMRNLLGRLIGENIELKFRLDPNLGLIKMDPTHCQQILLNLVLNARDAMPNGGQITIETSNCRIHVFPDPHVRASGPALLRCALFVVGDNGSGMDAATRSHLFEAFFTNKGGKGTGLGLATVHEIVTRNGGLIHVDSAPAQGTRVSVLLPLARDLAPNPERANEFSKERPSEELSSQK